MNSKVKSTLKLAGLTTIGFVTYKLTTCVIVPASGLGFLINAPIRIGELYIPQWFIYILASVPCVDPIANLMHNSSFKKHQNYDIPNMISNFAGDTGD